MTVQEYIASQTVRMAEALACFVETTPPDKLTWGPNVEGSAPTRSALEQVGECVVVNRLMANVLRGAAAAAGPNEGPVIENAADARRQLTDSAAEYAAAVRELTDADIAKEYQHPRGLMKGENVILMPLRNMAYHAGQINYIQILAGDAEFHVPPNWR